MSTLAAVVLVPLVAIGLLGVPALAVGTALFVDRNDPACSDTGPGSQTTPFCTIGAGATQAFAGQTVLVASGSYAEKVTVANSGTSSDPIVIRAAPGASVSLTSASYGFVLASKSWITIEGFDISGTTSYGIYVNLSSHVSILDNHVSYSGLPVETKTRYGIYFKATDSLISGNTVDHNTDAGIYLPSGAADVDVRGNVAFANARGYTRAAPGIDVRGSGNGVVGNVSYDNEDTGIQFYGGGSNLVANNVSYRNGDHGIDSLNSPNQTIVGNTVYLNTTSGINVEGTSSGATLANNVSVDNAMTNTFGQKGNIRVDSNSVAGTSIDHDQVFLSSPGTMFKWGTTSYSSLSAFQAATGQEPRGLEADPVFVAPSTGDLQPQCMSPAIDSANSGASGQQATDVEGNPRYDDPGVSNTGAGPRTYDDRGAYERQPPACGGNQPPVANNDTAQVDEDSTNNAIDVLTNDTDPDGGTLTVTGAGAASHGTTAYTPSGVIYTPDANYGGPDSFTYTISDGNGGTDTATVSVTVSLTQPPVANNDTAQVDEDSTNNAIDVLTNDTDPDGGTLTVTGAGAASHGTTAYTPSGVIYTPDANYVGPDSFTYTISDGNGGTAMASVDVTVRSTSGLNLVGNPGFETDLSGWNSGGKAEVTLTQVSGGHSGSFAVQLSNTGTTPTSSTLNDAPNWVATTTTGTYTASIWVRADAAGERLKVRLREYNGSTFVSSAMSSITLSTSWQQLTVTYVPQVLGSMLDFNAYVSSAPPGVCFYADDVSITLG